MSLIKVMVPSSKYYCKCPYSMKPIGICVHNTANDASARNEINYMINNNNEVSYHIAVDDKEAIQAIPFDRNAFHAGDGANGVGNRSYIAIEICYSKSGGTRFIQAEKRAAKEIAALMKQFGFTINNIKRHYDFSGKYCPHRTMDMGWDRFLNMVKNEYDVLNKPSESVSSGKLYRVRESWSNANSQKGAFSSLTNAVEVCKQYPGYEVYDENGKVVYPVQTVLYRVRESWPNVSSQKGAYKDLDNAIAECRKYPGYEVYDEKGNVVYPISNMLYRVRKSWEDASSQKGAYRDLKNAIAECRKHSGYSVYDENGKAVFTN